MFKGTFHSSSTRIKQTVHLAVRKAAVAVALLLAWFVFALWQHHEFGHERDRIRADLVRQSEVLRQAFLGGARAHRRLGRVFEEQMQAVMEEITGTSGVLAIRMEDEDRWLSIAAGKTDLLAATDDSTPQWLPQGLQTTEQVELLVLPRGQGQGGGGPSWARDLETEGQQLNLSLTLLMDRAAADAAIHSAAQQRIAMVLAGGAVLAALGVAWAALVRTIEARSQAQLLQAEKQRLEDLSQAASGLAHETRNPLGVIRAGLQKLMLNGSSSAPADGPSRLRLLVEECDRVTARINQFLAYARPQTADLKATRVAPLIDELTVLLQPDLDGAEVQLQSRIEPGCEAIVADANLLRQVLFNLLQNAISFSPQGETVELHLSRAHAGTATISIADRGPGVATEMADHLFAPYATTRKGGTGLGLAIVSRLSQQQGWNVRYKRRPDGGSLFLIEGVRVAA